MEIHHALQATPAADVAAPAFVRDARRAADRARERARAEAEVAAAIAVVAGHRELRVQVCGMAGDPALIRRMDERAAAVGVLLVWSARRGGALDVVARSA
jgi:hypothetical protein